MLDHNSKIVVFDLDETLGYFVELGMFISSIETILNIEIDDDEFIRILDLYPEFLRPKIMKILNRIKNNKTRNNNTKVMIYTNNQGSKDWIIKIKKYFEYKLNYKLFDQIIAAFKIQGKQIEPNRTTHNKTFTDFMRCTKLPKDTQIFFIDDQYHPQMEHPNVYYVNIKPYYYSLPFQEMIERYYTYKNMQIDKTQFTSEVTKLMEAYNMPMSVKNEEELKVDTIVTKYILRHLDEYFDTKSKSPTIKNRTLVKKTRRLK
jgi:hypothetical protein